MGATSTSAKQRIRVAYVEEMKMMRQHLKWRVYLGRGICLAAGEMRLMGVGETEAEQCILRGDGVQGQNGWQHGVR